MTSTRTPHRRIVPTVLTVLALGCAPAAQTDVAAKTLYVDGASGSDGVSYAENSASRPWKTIGRAAWGSTSRAAPNPSEAARAGDIVRIAAGTYATAGTDQRFLPAYNPANSGQPGRPIRFEADGAAHLTFASGAGPMIGAEGKDYIEWSGFHIAEAMAPSVPDTGPVLIARSTGGGVENCTLVGNPNWASRIGDNYDGIRIHGAQGQRIANNRFIGYGGDTGDENHNGIETYFAADLVIEHNEFENNGSGIYLKGNNPRAPTVGRFTIRYNYFTNNNEAIRVMLAPSTADQPNLIAQNVFYRNRIAVNIQVFDRGPADPRHAKVVNNVFVENMAALYVGGSGGLPENAGHVFANNIVSGGERAVYSYHPLQTLATKPMLVVEHNLYHRVETHALIESREHDLGSWRRATSQDSADPLSVRADPLFVDAAKRDFRLKPSSPAAALGRARFGVGGPEGTPIPAGAYITGSEMIGRQPRTANDSVGAGQNLSGR